MSSGTKDKVKGRVKEAAGAVAGDQQWKNEGKADQAAGKAKRTASEATDKAKKAIGK